jgi:hypothetical protein
LAVRKAAVFLALFIFAASSVWADLTEEQKNEIKTEAKNFKYQDVQTQEGLNFRVPEDMAIEKRNGIQVPVPFDEYMYGKFKQLDARLENIEKKLENIENILSPKPEPKPAKPAPTVLKSE